MSWSCTKCTYLNPPSQKLSCQICLSPSPPSAPSLSPLTTKWSCKACTFTNSGPKSNCEVCGTRYSVSLISDFEELDSICSNQELDSTIGSVFFPLQPCKRKNQEKDSNGEASEGFRDLGFFSSAKVSRKDETLLDAITPNAELSSLETSRKTQVSTITTTATTTPSITSESSEGSCDLGKFRSTKTSRKEGTLLGEITPNAGLSTLETSRKRQVSTITTTASTSTTSESSGGFCDLMKFRSTKTSRKEDNLTDNITPNAGSSALKILTYNVWFREDLEIYKRMKALGDLIQQHSPHVICFQEVTPNIYSIFQQTCWWKAYHCSVSTEMSDARPYFCMQLSKLPVKSFSCKPFSNSLMGRELCLAEVDVKAGKSLVVATSHLESPCPAPPTWDQMFSKERVAQAKEAVISLKNSPNVILGGDMNWDDKLDGHFPLPDGWIDVWAELRPGEDGYTYDTKSNQMLSANRKLQKRLDRFFCNLQDFKVSGIEIIGKEAIAGLSYCKEKKMKNEMRKLMLPVLPSDHYGLLLTICRK